MTKATASQPEFRRGARIVTATLGCWRRTHRCGGAATARVPLEAEAARAEAPPAAPVVVPLPNPPSASADAAEQPIRRRAARYAWALLLARIDEVFPLVCPNCGGEIRIIAFITEAVSVRQILAHPGEPTSPPRMAPTRGPPLWEMADAVPGDTDLRSQQLDPQAPPAPDYRFDQRIARSSVTFEGARAGKSLEVELDRHDNSSDFFDRGFVVGTAVVICLCVRGIG